MNEIEKKIEEIEKEMADPSFWQNKARAQELVALHGSLKDELLGVDTYDKGNAVISILAGAGGVDAEDFTRILKDMYFSFISNKGWQVDIYHENINDHGGIRNLTFEVSGKGAYGILKNESGVHRLVRISPFNAKKLRHTSFALVEVLPKFKKEMDIVIPEEDLEVSFARSSGPGGQNVNKRETAVRVVHLPTKISVHVESERSQARNRELAVEMIKAKLHRKKEEERRFEVEKKGVSKTTEIEWGNQIRSYVLHPYKMVKDHRTDYEERNIDDVLSGKIEGFLEAEKNL